MGLYYIREKLYFRGEIMKKFICLITAVVLIIGLSSCQFEKMIIFNGKRYAASLPSLILYYPDENDIENLKYMTNLTELCMQMNSRALNPIIYNLSPLSELTNLTKLHIIGGDGITDLSFLNTLNNLKDLRLNISAGIDLLPLTELTNLTELYLDNIREETDILPLCELTNLTKLRISGWQYMFEKTYEIYGIKNLTDISKLTNLTYLDLSDNKINDLSPLSGLINLQKLNLSGNEIDDLSPLNKLVNLTYLNLSGTTKTSYYDTREYKINDLSPLRELTGLTELYLDFHDGIKDLSPLKGLINLKRLQVGSPVIPLMEELPYSAQLEPYYMYGATQAGNNSNMMVGSHISSYELPTELYPDGWYGEYAVFFVNKKYSKISFKCNDKAEYINIIADGNDIYPSAYSESYFEYDISGVVKLHISSAKPGMPYTPYSQLIRFTDIVFQE